MGNQNGGRAKVGKIAISAVTKASQRSEILLSRNVPILHGYYSFHILYFSFQISFHAFFPEFRTPASMYIGGGEIIFRTRSTYLHAFPPTSRSLFTVF